MTDPNKEQFSSGLKPSKEFLERWEETRTKRTLGRLLEQFRIAAGLSTKELAKEIGAQEDDISRVESGRVPINKNDEKIVAKLGDYLSAKIANSKTP